MADIKDEMALNRFRHLRHWSLVLQEIHADVLKERVMGKEIQCTEDYARLLAPMSYLRALDALRCEFEREAGELVRKHGEGWSTLSEEKKA